MPGQDFPKACFNRGAITRRSVPEASGISTSEAKKTGSIYLEPGKGKVTRKTHSPERRSERRTSDEIA
jgi:hypothetical protein